MTICPQCCGYGSVVPGGEQVNVPNGTTFTAPTQVPLILCPSCQGNKYTTQAGT